MSMNIEDFGSSSLAVLSVGQLLLAAWGCGVVLVPLRRILASSCPFECAVVRITIGFALTGLAGVILGQLQFLSGNGPTVLLVVLALMTVVDMKAFRGAGADRFVVGRVCASVNTSKWLWLLPLGIAFLTLGPALNLPVGWDELVYHHVIPRRWNLLGVPAVSSDLPYSGFPSQAELLFWLMAPIEAAVAPRLLMWCCWLLALAGVWSRIVQRGGDSVRAILLVSALSVSPALLLVSANCYVESLLLLYAAAILSSMHIRNSLYLSADSYLPSVLTGCLAGGAASVKLTGIAFLPILLAWNLVDAWRNRLSGKPHWRIVLFLSSAAVVAAPYYFRPWIDTGNPLFPYFAEWFSADPQAIDMSRFHHDLGSTRFGLSGVAAFLTTPIQMAFHREVLDGSFGFQWLIFLGLACYAVYHTRQTRPQWCTIAEMTSACWLYVFWSYTAQQARFAIPLVPFVLPASATGLAELSSFQRRIVYALLVVGSLCSVPWKTAGYYLGCWETLSGVWTTAEYLDDNTGYTYVPLIKAVEELTPNDARVLLLFEHRSLYLPRACVIGTPFFQASAMMPPEKFYTGDEIVAELRRLEMSHVVLARRPVGPDQLPEWWPRIEPVLDGIESCLNAGTLRLIWSSEMYVLLEVDVGEQAKTGQNPWKHV